MRPMEKIEYAPANHPEITRVSLFKNRVPGFPVRFTGAIYLKRSVGHYGECWLCLKAPLWEGWKTPIGDQRTIERQMLDHHRHHGG